ncbi:hypothetical protein ABD91_14420 [Lysinibacillus sphaericus]|nr:hypothetical protein [Lysinibacillus sphaericus]MBG9757825.1 hypothetical protein [Lysinibacillus sphaericus]
MEEKYTTVKTSNNLKFLTSFVTIFLLSVIYFSENSNVEENSYVEENITHTVIEVHKREESKSMER